MQWERFFQSSSPIADCYIWREAVAWAEMVKIARPVCFYLSTISGDLSDPLAMDAIDQIKAHQEG